MAAAIALVSGGTVLLLPPRALPPPAQAWTTAFPVARGAYHVHSRRSDGTGTPNEIAAAARAAGLQFVVLTDHGDGTRTPDPPTYRSGVLFLDAVEISTSGGHYVALGLPATPYRLAGAPDAVIEDVRRLGGMGVAAHPDSANLELRWASPDAAIDGLEWLNADSEWRDELWASLGRGLFTYLFRPAETLAALLDRPARELARWDDLGARRRVVGLAGADAHARLGYRQAVDPYADRVIARLPSYESAFRTFENRLAIDRPLSGDPVADATQVLDAIRRGRVHAVVTGLAAAAPFEFTASSGRHHAQVGEYLDLEGTAIVRARLASPPETTLALLKDGQLLYDTREGQLHVDVGSTPGVYRVEARLPNQTGVPWLVSNPIYIGLRETHRAIATRPSRPASAGRASVPIAGWRAEVGPGSTSRVEVGVRHDGQPDLTWQYELASTEVAPFAAVRFPLEDGAVRVFDYVLLSIRANRPMRLWMQLRAPTTGERWGTTFYADETLRDVALAVSALRPLETSANAAPPLDRIDSLLLVADTLNGRPGERGTLHVHGVWTAGASSR